MVSKQMYGHHLKKHNVKFKKVCLHTSKLVFN